MISAESIRDEIDASVLEQLVMISRMKTLRKVIYGKRHRKNFSNRESWKSRKGIL